MMAYPYLVIAPQGGQPKENFLKELLAKWKENGWFMCEREMKDVS